MLTVLTVFSHEFSCDAVIRMIRVPRPSRLKAIQMPSARSDVWSRRSRPASARGDFGITRRSTAYALDCGPPIFVIGTEGPAGQSAVSHAVAQSAKSAMRGSCFRQTPDRVRRP